jgi:hypothetical protein
VVFEVFLRPLPEELNSHRVHPSMGALGE